MKHPTNMQKEQGVTTTISSVEEGCDNFGSSLRTSKRLYGGGERNVMMKMSQGTSSVIGKGKVKRRLEKNESQVDWVGRHSEERWKRGNEKLILNKLESEEKSQQMKKSLKNKEWINWFKGIFLQETYLLWRWKWRKLKKINRGKEREKRKKELLRKTPELIINIVKSL